MIYEIDDFMERLKLLQKSRTLGTQIIHTFRDGSYLIVMAEDGYARETLINFIDPAVDKAACDELNDKQSN